MVVLEDKTRIFSEFSGIVQIRNWRSSGYVYEEIGSQRSYSRLYTGLFSERKYSGKLAQDQSIEK